MQLLYTCYCSGRGLYIDVTHTFKKEDHEQSCKFKDWQPGCELLTAKVTNHYI